MSETLVQLTDLRYRIHQHGLLAVDRLQISAGQHWCFFGGNGAGKTLLSAIISGRLAVPEGQCRYSSGFDPQRDICEVSFEEQNRLVAYDHRHDISEFSAAAEDPGTTVLSLMRQDGTEDQIADILEQLGIFWLKDRGIRYLSSGQLRRAVLARALCRNPRVLILDNPLESIDRESATKIVDTIRAWMGEHNTVVLLCRRAVDILSGITHLAVLDDLALGIQGNIQNPDVRAAVEQISSGSFNLPSQLPPPCTGRSLPQAPADQPLIALRGVDAGYGTQPIFRSIHWEMWAGHHVLIEGPNGSGKSTLLGLIDGENHKAYRQPVYLFGRLRGSGETVWDIKARFGVVSNELHNRYIKGWRVLDVVVSGFFDSIGLYDDSGASETRTAKAWLAVVGLQHLDRCYYHELSFGQQRLVLLVRAMVKQPLILVLDEPCVGLDDYHRRLLLALLDKISEGGRTHILYVSHTEGEAPACITHKMVLSKPEGGTTQLALSTC